MELTENEVILIEILRQLNPYEKVTIQKDSKGVSDYYIVTKEQKLYFQNK